MNNTHMCVFAKHEGSDKEFIFSVPVTMEVNKGDILVVETIRGKCIATATSEMFEGKNIDEVAEKFGAYLPLKKVVSALDNRIKEYIIRKERERIILAISENKIEEDLPF